MNREGTLHIVWMNRGRDVQPRYRAAFAAYSSPGGAGALKTIELVGERSLRNLFLRVGLNERVVKQVFSEFETGGQASVLQVILPDETLRELGLQGPPRNPKDKIEAAIVMLKRQKHSVRTVIRETGTMWFEIDDHVLVPWDDMINLADGVYSFEVLAELYRDRQAWERRKFEVRFAVFREQIGTILAYALEGNPDAKPRSGVRYPDDEALVNALNAAKLPGREIVAAVDTAKRYTASGAQLSQLGFSMWFYQISGSGSRSVAVSDAVYPTEKDAIDAGRDFLESNKELVQEGDPHEVFSIMAGRK